MRNTFPFLQANPAFQALQAVQPRAVPYVLIDPEIDQWVYHPHRRQLIVPSLVLGDALRAAALCLTATVADLGPRRGAQPQTLPESARESFGQAMVKLSLHC
jgi:hypothetical protein